MFDHNFDPYEALQDLARNQETLYNNDQNISAAINSLQARITEQQKVIDGLVKQVQSTNKANEILLDSFLKEINKSIKDMKWPNHQ